MSEKQSISTKKAPKTNGPGTGKGGFRAGSGRKKGVPNRITADLKDMILSALEGAGGVDYLQERASDPRTASAFLTLIGKVLPMQVTGPGDGPIAFERIVRVIVKPPK